MLGFLGYYQEFIPSFARLTKGMNGMRNKQQLTTNDWTPEINFLFQELKGLFLDQGDWSNIFPFH